MVKCFVEISWVCLVVDGEFVNDCMSLWVELVGVVLEGFVECILVVLCEVIKLCGEVELVLFGSLFNDGCVIEDWCLVG